VFEDLLRFDKKKKLLFLDFETENLCLYHVQNLAWQGAMLKAEGDEIKDTYATFIKWHRPLNVGAIAAQVTRYDAAKVASFGVDYKVVIPKFVEWTQDADYIIGHNILGFDIYFLMFFYRQCGQNPFGIAEKMIDTHCLAKGIKLNHHFDFKKQSLLEYQYQMLHTIAKGVKTKTDVLGPEYGIEHDYANLHDALNDIQLNFKIWQKIKFMVEI